MFSNKTPFLFPHSSVPYLHEMREENQWAALVERVAALPEVEEESLAFQLMMIRICGCLRCTSYKANLGCTTCSQRAVRNSKASTGTMIHWFTKAQEEVRAFLDTQIVPVAVERAA
jgi:Tat protein secretion system quality control protein TatD with DNase activity